MNNDQGSMDVGKSWVTGSGRQQSITTKTNSELLESQGKDM